MAETLRIVTFAAGGRPVGRKDLLVADTYQKVAESTEIVPGSKNQVMAKRVRRYGGARQVAESTENGEYKATWLITGATQDACMTNLDTLLAELEAVARPGRFLEWQPDGASYPTYYELVATPIWTPHYKWYELVNNPAMLQAEISFPIAPLARMARYDIYDDFSVDSIGDYTFDTGGATVAGGRWTYTSTATKRWRHTARGHKYGDVQVTRKVTFGASVGGTSANYFEITVKSTGPNDHLRVRLRGDSVLALAKVVGGAATGIGTDAATLGLVAGGTYWFRLRIESNVLQGEFFTSPPTPASTPAASTSAYPLTAAEAALFGAAVVGDVGGGETPQATDWTADDFQVEAFTYKGRTLPDVIALGGAIPGDAPALVDVEVTHSGGSAAPAWALLGWSERPSVFNYVWNGDFEDDTNGWFVTSSDLVNAASSITRVTTAAKFGSASGEVVCPATTNAGAHFKLYGKFRKGVTYSARVWVRSAAQITPVSARLGQAADSGASSGPALSATWQELTLTWTPTADREWANFAVRIEAATATTFQIDGAKVYEGAVEPTLSSQSEGRGGLAPFGIIPAESCDAGDLSGWAITADANYRHGQGLKVTAAGAGTAAAQWFIDPALLAADDFTLQELDVEVFAKVDLASTLASPKLNISCRPEAGTNFGTERFTGEWQSAGRLLTKPSSGSVFRTVRLGILTLVCDPDRPVRWKLRAAASWAVGSTGNYGLDELYLVPVRKRAAGPTGKPNDATYPDFIASTGETTKTIRSDLSGLVAKPPANPFPDSGLDGMVELALPPGNVDVLVKLASAVPDDPTSDTSSEQKEHTATVHLNIWPRVQLLRGA